jgi:hypothetical protein
MLKFGRLAMADALSGTSGQVVPERDLAAIALIDAGDEIDPGDSTDLGGNGSDPDGDGAEPGDPSTIEPGGRA